MISGFSGGHLRGSGDHFWVTKINKNDPKSSPKMIQNRCLEGAVVPGRLLAPDGFRGGSRDTPGPSRGASCVAFAAPNGAMLCARCAPRGLRKRKKIGMKIGSFSHGPRRSVFFENLVVLGRQKGGFRVPKGSKISLQVKNVQKAPGSTIPIGI